MRMRVWLMLPVAALLIGTAACGGGEPASTGAPAGQNQPVQNEPTTPEPKETPLTGDTKQKAERAALAEYPGEVVKSEIDRERPGHYAVEIRQSNGETVEVYLDKSFAVVGTKDELAGGDEDGD